MVKCKNAHIRAFSKLGVIFLRGNEPMGVYLRSFRALWANDRKVRFFYSKWLNLLV
jgi:hypothetical protein